MSNFGTTRRSFRIEKLTRLASWKSDIYPPEIWEHIFSYLTGLQLLRARLVCRRWRDIVTGCPPLMRKLRIRLERKRIWRKYPLPDNFYVMDRNFNPTWLLPVTEIIFQDQLIAWIGPWWTRIAQRLTHLTLSGGFMDLSLLIVMLRHTRNLQSLQIRESCLTGTAELNVQFTKLQKLNLDELRCCGDERTNLLDVFDKIFPRVKDLRIRKIWKEDFNVDRLLSPIRALAGTLEALEVDNAAVNVLRDLPELTRLRRTSLHVEPRFNWDSWAKFFRTQRLIEDLVIYTDELTNTQVLRDIGRAVPNLKRLTLHITDRIDTDFLKFMPNLQYFELRGDLYNTIVLPRKGSARLTEIRLREVTITGFWKFLDRSPHLARIALNSCVLDDEDSNAKVSKNLRAVEIDRHTNISLGMLQSLLRKCPFLEELVYCNEETYDESVVPLICERLKGLRKLSLQYCSVTDADVGHLASYGLALEEVRLSRHTLCLQTVKQLRATRNIHVCVIDD
ncbi:hypothetical protein quinque_000098 [Culex quinquefasciatus]